MSKLKAYELGHFRIPGYHQNFHEMSDLYWVRFIDAVGIWCVPVEGDYDE
jgi:hypothetical protein